MTISAVTAISPEAIETFLNRPESETLDFKVAQYHIVGATDDEKSKLVKDILAFANAWKSADAHIVIGVQDNQGPAATVVGGVVHIDDATIQQLVNSKTNRAVRFEYIPLEYEGKSIAIIRIEKDQDRPIFLLNRFGKMKANVVYVRRGSSTAEANPDEIAKMGRDVSAAAHVPTPKLALGIREGGRRGPSGDSVRLRSRVLEEDPLRSGETRAEPLSPTQAMIARFAGIENKPTAKEIRRFLREEALLRSVVVCVDNPGPVLAINVHVELRLPVTEGLEVRTCAPEQPRRPLDLPLFRPPSNDVFADQHDGEWEVLLLLDKIQPGTCAFSDRLWIGCTSPRTLTVSARVTGDNFSPINQELSIVVDVEHGSLEEAEEAYERVGDTPPR